MKKIAILFIGLSLLSTTSCNFLETETYDYLEEGDLYQSEESCMAGLAGVYDALGTYGCYGQNLWADLDGGTDIMVYNRNNNSMHIPGYNYNNTDNALKTSWAALYDGINRANNYIELIANRSDAECGGADKHHRQLGWW